MWSTESAITGKYTRQICASQSKFTIRQSTDAFHYLQQNRQPCIALRNGDRWHLSAVCFYSSEFGRFCEQSTSCLYQYVAFLCLSCQIKDSLFTRTTSKSSAVKSERQIEVFSVVLSRFCWKGFLSTISRASIALYNTEAAIFLHLFSVLGGKRLWCCSNTILQRELHSPP